MDEIQNPKGDGENFSLALSLSLFVTLSLKREKSQLYCQIMCFVIFSRDHPYLYMSLITRDHLDLFNLSFKTKFSITITHILKRLFNRYYQIFN